MFKKIVCATDGSEAAERALALARQLTTEGRGELLAVHDVELTVPGKGREGDTPCTPTRTS